MPNKISQFWQELKRRKVTRTITVYAAAAFVSLELASIIVEPLRLPEWTLPFIIVLLCVGFIIAVILSWIYDIHPEGGIVKTEQAKKVTKEPVPPSSKGWKIASYISFVVIVALIILNIIPRTGTNEVLDKSIAVLPFESLSDDPEKQYLADGVMEDILLHLAKIEDLRVMSSTSVQQYRNTDKTATEICQELDVSYLLEGRFQKYGDKARLIVQLIQTGIEGHAWANDYNREWTDIFTVQSEVAQEIAREIHAVINPEEKQRIEKIPTTNMSAYDLYLKGIQTYYDFWKTGAIEQVHLSIDYFMKAIELDPEYSLAYTGLGRAYWMLGQFGPNRSPIHWKESKSLLMKAISLDPTNGWAYSELGVVLSNWYWDSAASTNAFEKALGLSPNREDVYDHYVSHTYRVGNCERLASLLRGYINRFDPDNDLGVVNSNLLLLTCREEFEEITRIADLEWDRNTGFVETTYIAQAYTIIGD
jgi:TolB-like protein